MEHHDAEAAHRAAALVLLIARVSNVAEAASKHGDFPTALASLRFEAELRRLV